MSDRWAIADLRATAIMDRMRTGAVAERNRRKLEEAAGLATQAAEPGTQAREPASTPSCKHDGSQARGHESTPPDGWLPRLMACPSWSGRRLEPEEELSLWVAAELRRLTRSGALRAVWTRCPVEVRRGGKLAAMWQCLGRVLGVVPGAPDFWFAWGTGAGLLELKVERPADLLDLRQDGTARAPTRTYLRQVQKDFREWAVSNGVKHAVCRSVPEVLATLREWGRLM